MVDMTICLLLPNTTLRGSMSLFDNIKAGERYGFDFDSSLTACGSEYREGVVIELDTTTGETFCFFRCAQDGTTYALPESRCRRLVGPIVR